MIPKIANNKTNQEELNLEPTEKIVEKLNYYRTLFDKLHELSEAEISELTDNISIFFNLKTVGFSDKPPEDLFRISNNNKILSSLGKELNFLTDISHILAPPIENCWYNRCNIPKQQILYCATDEATAYWETKPQKGDVITISHFKLKENAVINCNVIRKEKISNPKILNQLQEVAFYIDDFFTEIFSREIPRDKPLQYLFSAVISSQHLFYPIPSDKNIEAIIYPSVQRKKHGYNLALQNDLILKKYDLVSVTTRFIVEEYKDIEPTHQGPTVESLISAITINQFNFENSEIIYPKEIIEKFSFFRNLQTSIISGEAKQVRYDAPKQLSEIIKEHQVYQKQRQSEKTKKLQRNDRINVKYKDGTTKMNTKYKDVKNDLELGKCFLLN